MFSHVMIGTNDLEKAKAFYDALLGTLGVRPARVDGHRIFYFTKTGVFSVSKPINGEPATHANGGTIGFAADSPEQADAWHAAGIANGGKTCEIRPAFAKVLRANCTSPICAISTATRSARCTGYRHRQIVGWVRRSRNPPLRVG
jgi:catechol 2,3-dioxygenase-like lactoylglutathione lyase family enzyme